MKKIKLKICLLILISIFLININFIFSTTPISISNCQELQNINNNLIANYQLSNDFNCSGITDFISIGNLTNPFIGNFNGNNYTISNLNINPPRSSYLGLFGYVNNSKIYDLNLINVTINKNGGYYAGGLVGGNENTEIDNIKLENIHMITNFQGVGGLIGTNINSNVSNSYSIGKIQAQNVVGGLIGTISKNSNIYNSYAITNFELDHSKYSNSVGGLIGGISNYEQNCNKINIYNVSAKGNLTGNSNLGGLIGTIFNPIDANCNIIINNSHSSVQIKEVIDYFQWATVKNIGGLIGENEGGKIFNSYSTGNISGINNIGGLIGTNTNGQIFNSYATGNVTGTDIVGGLIGNNSNSSITNSYSVGKVIGSSNVGGLIGLFTSNISNSYYNSQTSGQTDTGKGIPKNTTEMMIESTFQNWDFINSWQINESYNYPKIRLVPLINNPPLIDTINPITIIEGELITIIVNADDFENDSLIYSINDTRFTNTTNIFTFQTTIGDKGNFIVKINITDGYNIISQNISITINEYTPPQITQTTSSGSSGGGSSRRKSKSTIIEVDLFNQTNFQLAVNSKLTFEIGEQKYSLQINKIGLSNVNITIENNSINFVLRKKETALYDLDNDNIKDIQITLNNFMYGDAFLEIQNLKKEIIKTPLKIEKEEKPIVRLKLTPKNETNLSNNNFSNEKEEIQNEPNFLSSWFFKSTKNTKNCFKKRGIITKSLPMCL